MYPFEEDIHVMGLETALQLEAFRNLANLVQPVKNYFDFDKTSAVWKDLSNVNWIKEHIQVGDDLCTWPQAEMPVGQLPQSLVDLVPELKTLTCVEYNCATAEMLTGAHSQLPYFHRDDELTLEEPVTKVLLGLGQTRTVRFVHSITGGHCDFELAHGDMLILDKHLFKEWVMGIEPVSGTAHKHINVLLDRSEV